MINTLDKFLDATGFNRSDNYPSVQTLRAKIKELKVKRDKKVDIMSYFLYDAKSR